MPDTTPVPTTDVISVEQQLSMGEGTVFKGSPNTGVCGGSAESPQLNEALAQVGHYQGATPPGV